MNTFSFRFYFSYVTMWLVGDSNQVVQRKERSFFTVSLFTSCLIH
jgi:hypothetical protein